MAGSRRTITSVEFWEIRRPLDFRGSRGQMCKVTHARVGGRIACGLDERSWPQPQDVPWPNPVLGRAWRCPNCVRAVRIGRLAHRSKKGRDVGTRYVPAGGQGRQLSTPAPMGVDVPHTDDQTQMH